MRCGKSISCLFSVLASRVPPEHLRDWTGIRCIHYARFIQQAKQQFGLVSKAQSFLKVM